MSAEILRFNRAPKPKGNEADKSTPPQSEQTTETEKPLPQTLPELLSLQTGLTERMHALGQQHGAHQNESDVPLEASVANMKATAAEMTKTLITLQKIATRIAEIKKASEQPHAAA